MAKPHPVVAVNRGESGRLSCDLAKLQGITFCRKSACFARRPDTYGLQGRSSGWLQVHAVSAATRPGRTSHGHGHGHVCHTHNSPRPSQPASPDRESSTNREVVHRAAAAVTPEVIVSHQAALVISDMRLRALELACDVRLAGDMQS